MKAAEMLDRCKLKLGLSSDYALAKELGIPRMRVSDYRAGKVKMDEYTMFRIAEILEESPSSVIAQIMAEKARTEDKRLFFKRYFTIAGLWIILGVLSVGFNGSTGTALADGKTAETRMDSTYKPIMRTRRFWYLVRQWFAKNDKIVAYFTCNWTRKVLRKPCLTA